MPRPPHGNWNNGFWHGYYWGYPWLGPRQLGVAHTPPVVLDGRCGRLARGPGRDVRYVNPYVVTNTTTVVIEPPVDYSQPLPPPERHPRPGRETTDPATRAAIAFDEGRAAFKRRDYKTALAKADAAIRQLPGDATLHEFRALTLFAMGAYPNAAETIYAVLAVGPGWS